MEQDEKTIYIKDIHQGTVLNNLSQLLIRGAAITFGAKVFGRILMFGYVALLSRYIGAEGIGLFFIAFSVVNFAVVIAKLGLNNGLIRYVSIYHGINNQAKLKGVFLSSIGFSLIGSLFMAVVVHVAAPVLSVHVFHDIRLLPILRRFTLIIPLIVVISMISATFQGLKQTFYSVCVEDISLIVFRIAFTGLLIYVGLGVIEVINAYGFALLGSLFVGVHILSDKTSILNTKIAPKFEHKTLLTYSYPLLFIGFVQLLIAQADILMVGYYMPSEDVGYYSVAAKVSILLTFVLGAFNSIFPSMIADLYNKNHFNKIKSLFQKEVELIFLISFLIMSFIVLNGNFILSLFGPEFNASFGPMVILCLGWFVDGITGSGGYLLTMTGNQKLEVYNTVFLAISNIVFNILLIPKFGLIGAAVSTSVSLLLINMLRLVQVFRKLHIHPFGLAFIRNCIVAISSISVIFPVYKSNYLNGIHFEPFRGIILFALLLMVCVTSILLLRKLSFCK